jgi:nucleoid DNA-binding protein
LPELTDFYIQGETYINKAELVEKIAQDAGINKVEAQTSLESFNAGVTKSLKKKDGKITLDRLYGA